MADGLGMDRDDVAHRLWVRSSIGYGLLGTVAITFGYHWVYVAVLGAGLVVIGSVNIGRVRGLDGGLVVAGKMILSLALGVVIGLVVIVGVMFQAQG